MPYENSGTPASLISHALNDILALGIPRYTYGQLVATAIFQHSWERNTIEVQKKQDTKLSVHMHKRSKAQQDAIIRFQQLGPHMHSPLSSVSSHSLVAIPHVA